MRKVVSHYYCFLLITLIFTPLNSSAQNIPLPERPEESITYWKTFEILPDEDPKVKETHQIFERLLLGWEETRIAPTLHVVHSDKGPWAASLDDGTILLSRESIDICWRNSLKGKADRLAFVLAHELAHQRADHLWHRRFFRLAGQQPPKVRGHMMGGISANQLEVADLEARETQADREGLLLMAMVGFDPEVVVGDDSRFFYEWIESIWGEPCKGGANGEDCAKAKSRAERMNAYWHEAALQSTIFALGVQSYVAGRYVSARQYFTAYGHQFPGREVHNNIGLTHVGEAMALRKKLLDKGGNLGTEFIYPIILKDKLDIQKDRSRNRGGTQRETDAAISKWHKEMKEHLDEAAHSFESALKIDPSDRQIYWNLASTYLLAGNAPLSYGVIAGNYVKLFGQDAMAFLLLGMTAYLDGQADKSRNLFDQALSNAVDTNQTLIIRMNRAIYLSAIGDSEGEQREWKALADMGRKEGDETLFRIALQQMGRQTASAEISDRKNIERLHDFSLGQRIPDLKKKDIVTKSSDVWVEGERMEVYSFSDGGRMVMDANRKVIALWQGEGSAVTGDGVSMGDDTSRVGRAYGVPSRTIRTVQGDYWAYDSSRIAFRILDNKVAGWFLYVVED